MPTGSVVVLKYDGNDITTDVLWNSARFESQINAVPGTFGFTVVDRNHTYNFITGKRISLEVDGTMAYGGFVIQVQRSYPFSAMDTTTIDPGEVPRYWQIQGVDFNVLFDKRVLRNPSDYLHQLPNFTGDRMDGWLIKHMMSLFLDVDGIEYNTYVEDIRPPFNGTPDASRKGAWLQQGSYWRKQMEDFAQFTGGIWYLKPTPAGSSDFAELHYHAIENVVHRWGFSDAPNKGTTVSSSPASYQNVTIGPREIDATEDGSVIINDALIWGGSQWAGRGGTVFAREENTASIDDHYRWQLAETHFGEDGYKLQEGVDVRADIIVNGPPGAVAADQNRGLKYPQWNFRHVWFAHQVPTLSGVRNHITPGSLVTIQLVVFGPDGSPLVQLLPLRSVAISFLELDPTGKGYVRYEGFFGLQPDDPWSLWRYILRNRGKILSGALTFVDQDSTATVYGATGNFIPTPTPNGSATVFTIAFGYVINSTRVYLRRPGETGAALLNEGSDYVETDPINGIITMTSAPPSGSVLLVNCRTLSA